MRHRVCFSSINGAQASCPQEAASTATACDPSPGVDRWLRRQGRLHLSVITVEEVAQGLAWKPKPRVAAALTLMMRDLCIVHEISQPIARRGEAHVVSPLKAGLHLFQISRRGLARGLARDLVSTWRPDEGGHRQESTIRRTTCEAAPPANGCRRSPFGSTRASRRCRRRTRHIDPQGCKGAGVTLLRASFRRTSGSPPTSEHPYSVCPGPRCRGIACNTPRARRMHDSV